MKFLPSCSSLCLSNIFGNLSLKDRFPLEIKGHARHCGAGVFTGSVIPRGAIVCCYLGELVAENDISLQRSHTIELEAYYKCWAYLKLNGRHSLIDAHKCGNTGRFINHGCGSSANLIQCILEQHSQCAVLCFVARREIAAGEELRWNYFSGKEGKDKQKCMWWGECSCPDCNPGTRGEGSIGTRRRRIESDSD
jgi:SET domain-containing protein